MTRRKLALIDGNSLLYRAFFALPTTLATTDGRVTNAVYGFTSMLIRLLREEKPDAIVVAFDLPGKTFRHEAYEHYKAHRPETPNELVSQMPLARQVLDALAIPVVEKEGFEADDVLGTLARRAAAEGDEVMIVTGDRDAFQLIDEHVRVMTTRKGISDIVVYDRDGVVERYGIPPERVVDYVGLKGDTSDNIPGVPGVGEKTASQLVSEFGTLDALYERLDEIKSEKLRTRLSDAREDAFLSRALATIDTDVPVDVDPDSFELGGWDLDRVEEVFRDLQFTTLLERFLTDQGKREAGRAAGAKAPAKAPDARASEGAGRGEAPRAEPPTPKAAIAVETLDARGAAGFVTDAARGPAVALGAGRSAPVISAAVVAGSAGQGALFDESESSGGAVLALAIAVRTGVCADEASASSAREAVAAALAAGSLALAGHDLKDAWAEEIAGLPPAGVGAPPEADVDLAPAVLFDTAIAAYLIESNRSDYPLDGLAWEYLDRRLAGPEEGAEPPARAAERARASYDLVAPMASRLEDDGLAAVMHDIEMPLIGVLARMEIAGVGLDCDKLTEFGEELTDEIAAAEKAVYVEAEGPFNIGSPKQLGEVLFEKLGLPRGKRTKTGYSTDASVLEKLAADFPVVRDILKYRELTKLKSTYLDALPRLADADGRVHTTFNQTVAATGRLSSTNPNLQNIPVRTDLGKRIRESFVPARPGDLLMVADYSQIELRVLAHLSHDETLAEAFAEGLDIHAATAAEVFSVPPEEVDSEMRRKAKAVNFGLVYGQSAHGLAETLGISREEAQQYITLYFSRYPGVQEYIQTTIGRALTDGFVATLAGRRRHIPELRSSNFQLRQFGERTAVNSPIQGSAADIIKLAMIAVDARLAAEKDATRMVLQVHDELVFEVPPEEKESATALVRAEMEGAYKLAVPIVVDIGFGPNWGDAK
jgi:DNA polymerase-1